MIKLYFNPQKFSRLINRVEWKEIWRWKRMVEKRLDAEVQIGTTWPEHIQQDFIDKTINPPLLVHDKQE